MVVNPLKLSFRFQTYIFGINFGLEKNSFFLYTVKPIFPPLKVYSAYKQTKCIVKGSRAVFIIFGLVLNLLHLSKSQFELGKFIEIWPSSLWVLDKCNKCKQKTKIMRTSLYP